MTLKPSQLPTLLTFDESDATIETDVQNRIFSEDKEVDTIMTYFYCLGKSEYSFKNHYSRNFQFMDLLNLSRMINNCALFIEEQIGCHRTTGQTDPVRKEISKQLINIINNFYKKLSQIPSSTILKLRIALESDLELFTTLSNLLPLWNAKDTINFFPDDSQYIVNPTFINMKKTINDIQLKLYSNKSDLTDILSEILAQVTNCTEEDLSRQLYEKLSVKGNPLMSVIYQNSEACHTNKFDILFPNSYRARYFAHRALEREIVEVKKSLTDLFLLCNANDEMCPGVPLLRWRMRVYLDELHFSLRLQSNDIPETNGLDDLIKNYKIYCNKLEFDINLYELINQCSNFSKYFINQYDPYNVTKRRVRDIAKEERILTELWCSFYKQCSKCTWNTKIRHIDLKHRDFQSTSSP